MFSLTERFPSSSSSSSDDESDEEDDEEGDASRRKQAKRPWRGLLCGLDDDTALLDDAAEAPVGWLDDDVVVVGRFPDETMTDPVSEDSRRGFLDDLSRPRIRFNILPLPPFFFFSVSFLSGWTSPAVGEDSVGAAAAAAGDEGVAERGGAMLEVRGGAGGAEAGEAAAAIDDGPGAAFPRVGLMRSPPCSRWLPPAVAAVLVSCCVSSFVDRVRFCFPVEVLVLRDALVVESATWARAAPAVLDTAEPWVTPFCRVPLSPGGTSTGALKQNAPPRPFLEEDDFGCFASP